MKADVTGNADLPERLRRLGILPSAQRVAIAQFVLSTSTHPAADEVYRAIQGSIPTLSLATVYNTLHLFAEKGLLRELSIAEGKVVFDPRMDPHHHLVDEDSGAIHDVPWSALRVERAAEAGASQGYDVREYQVVLRGRKRSGRTAASRKRRGRAS
jgi:Fe2+ or Zn2+ uptake regulation protein